MTPINRVPDQTTAEDGAGTHEPKELRFATAQRAARMCAWECDLASGQMRVSENAPDVIGALGVFPVGEGWFALGDEDALPLRRAVEDAIADQDAGSAEFRWIRRDTGAVRWMEVHGSVLFHSAGETPKAAGVVRDITDRKCVEHALQTNGQQLATELGAFQQLQEISTRLFGEGDTVLFYEHLLDAAVAIMRSEYASMQMFYPERGEGGELRLLAYRGFNQRAAKSWAWVASASRSCCGLALRAGRRVIVPDIDASEYMAGTEDQETYRDTGIHAVQSTPLVSRSGRIVGMISTHWNQPHEPSERDLRLFDILARQAADLIERNRAEEELRESEQWLAGQREALAATLNGAPLETSLGILARTVRAVMGERVRAGFYLANPEGTTLHHIVGMGAEYGEAMDGFRIGPDSLACGRAAYTGNPVLTTDVTKDPDWRPWLWLADKFGYRGCWSFPIHTMAGKFVGTFAVYWPERRRATARDRELAELMTQAAAVIISRHSDAEFRRRAEDELRRANVDLEQFAYSASHDLQEPLRTVNIFSELLERRHAAKLDGEALDYLKNVRTGVLRMERLVRDLLLYSQVTKLDAPAERSDADEALKAATGSLTAAIADSGAVIECPEKLPSVTMHGMHLQLVFQNLVGNAVKYRRADVAPVVRVSARRRNNEWLFAVHDNGIGIEPEFQQRIFGLFKRLHTNDKYSGTGIGLALCQRIVERYQGRIWVDSQAGSGSTFYFAIPV